MRIRVLETKVADQIAAGEVVERPAQLLKELLENSLDSGADEIKVEIFGDGREVIVTDNGTGIHPDDLMSALNRFATSKIKSVDDLWGLSSFGFRGEALASIASVSHLLLSSRQADFSQGYRVKSEFGSLTEREELGHTIGTRIHISRLFENVPARLKFLKSNSTELSQIRQMIRAIGLSHHQVNFKIFENGEIKFIWPKTELQSDRVTQVLETEKLFSGSYTKEGYRVLSFFCAPNETMKSNRGIWMFAQNRWIQDKGIAAAIHDAYKTTLMNHEYPIAVVFVTCEEGLVDVNIHPTKSQVRFENNGHLFRAVYHSIRGVLEKAPWLKFNLPKTDSIGQSYSPTLLKFENQVLRDDSVNYQFASQELHKTLIQKKEADSLNSIENSKGMGFWSGLNFLSQSHLTYLICENDAAIVFVDQHAAHERVLFEKLMTKWRTGIGGIQRVLIPVTFETTAVNLEFLKIHFESLNQIGIELDILGPEALGIMSHPELISEVAVVHFLEDLCQSKAKLGVKFEFEKVLHELFATMACHSAVRAGQSLSSQEAKSLLNEMDEFPLSSFCPHGRPVSIEFPIQRIEREFGRIV